MQGMIAIKNPDAPLAAMIAKRIINVHLHTRLDLKCDHDRLLVYLYCLDPSQALLSASIGC